ncbi:hypothetical protein AAG906_033780 [Vitis piasezkii]
MKQAGGSIEKYYNDLQELWRNRFSDVLQLKPFPTVEQAYAFVRRGDVRQTVMISSADTTPGATPPKPGALSLSSGKSNSSSKTKTPSDGMKCTHCGNSIHTRDTCFKLHGYLDWWNDFQARKKRETSVNDDHTRKAVVVTCDPSLSLIPQVESPHDPGTSGKTLHISTHNDDDDWILDFGATDYMTFDSNDFSNATQSRLSCVINANGVTYSVIGAGTVTLSLSFSLSNTLLVSSLSNRLTSDILTKKIIGHGTKRGGLYYVDDFSSRRANHMHYTLNNKERQNGTAEKKNMHILETTRALLINAHVPNRYWSDAVATTVHLLNRMPTKVLQFQTPLKVISDHVSLPTILMIPPRIFGCVAFVHLHKNQRTKLDPCAVRCLFLGYGVHKKGYRCYDPIGKRTYITMDVTFLESKKKFPSPISNSLFRGRSIVNNEIAYPNDGNDMVEPPRIEAEPILESSEDAKSDESFTLYSSITPLQTNAIDTSVGYVLPFRHNRGKPPYQYSLDIEEQRSKYPIAKYVSTQRLSEPLRAFAHTLSSCQIPSSVEEALSDSKWAQTIKEELEALQKNNIWFLSVLPKGRKIMGCKVLLSLAANLDWPLHQLDVKNAFLHGDLEEEIFMDIPPGYTATSEAKIACSLQQALYGLKQSPRAWFGIEVARSRQGIFLSQRKYILDLLAEVGLLECKPVDIPIVQNHKLGEYVNQVPANTQRYQRLVGKLIYLSHARPDIAYAVSVVSQFMHCPSEDHMDVVMRILRYLKSSPGKGLIFSKNGHLNVAGYIDADWAGNITDRKSTLGYFTSVGGNLVTWRSKKKKVVALFSIGVAPSSEMNLLCDNKAAIAISHNPVQHDRTKHVEVDRNFIKQNLEEKII